MLRHFSLSALCLLLATAAWPQAEITSLAAGDTPLEGSSDLRLERFADFAEVELLSLGDKLEIGDLLSSISSETAIELSCGETSLLRFSGRFRVLINPPGETDCAVNLLGGQLDVLTDAPTEVRAGGMVLGSEGTQYAVRLERDPQGGVQENVTVFDGKLWVRGRDRDNQRISAEIRQIETGETWGWDGKESSRGKLNKTHSQRAAKVYARLDLAKSYFAEEIPGSPGTTARGDIQQKIEQLKALHANVLSKPDDPSGRAELAKTQLDLKIGKAAIYNLKRAEIDDEVKLRSYRIDPAAIPEPQKEKLYQPKAQFQSQIYRLPTAVLAQPLASNPWALLDQQNYSAALTALTKLAKREPTARVYCGLAQAYGGVDGWTDSRAGTYASRALRLVKRGQKIPAAELRICRILHDLQLPR